MGNIVTGATPPTKDNDNFINSGYLWVTPGDISSKKFVSKTERNLSEKGLKNGRKLDPNSILVTCIGATIGKLCMINEIGSCNQQLNAISANKNFYPDFIYYVIQKTAKNLILIAGNTATPILNKKSFGNLSYIFPSFNEQKKIALFLDKIDKKRELLEKKYEFYQDFKKYLMQQIFTQKLRFANFNKKWIKYQFKDLGIVKSGVGFSKKYQGHLNLDYNLYKVSDMNLKVNKKYMVKSNNTVDNFILKDMNTKLIEKPSIIFAKVGEAIFLNRKRIVINPFLIDNNMMAFSPNNKVNLEFIYYLSLTINFGKYAQIGALPSYNASDIYSIKCEIPSIEEQEKISSILSLVDEKIDYIKSYINNIITFKKGLLQQMFV